MNPFRIGSIFVIICVAVAGVMMLIQAPNLYKTLPVPKDTGEVANPYEAWRPYTSEKSNYTVSFPAIAQDVQESVEDPVSETTLFYDMTVAQKWDTTVYMVTVITYPNAEQSTEKMRQFLQETATGDKANNLLAAEEGEFRGKPAIYFTLKNVNGLTKGLLFFINEKLYFLSGIYPEEVNEEEFQYFINSFQQK